MLPDCPAPCSDQIFHAVDADLNPQKGAELFVHAAHQLFAVDAHDVMAVIELFQNVVHLAACSFADADAEDVSHFVGGKDGTAPSRRSARRSCEWGSCV